MGVPLAVKILKGKMKNTAKDAWNAELEAENTRRNAALATIYDPLTGRGCCGDREALKLTGKVTKVMVPVAMLADERCRQRMTWSEHAACRITYDFEFWCAECVKIKDKVTSRTTAFILNAPQRRLLAELEKMRQARQPIRLILLKARQWGGSTLVQMYMAWMQTVLHTHWNSLICGHLKDTAASIKGMYNRLLAFYPREYCENGEPMRFRAFEKSRNVSEITGRGCLVAMGSAESQEAIRGYDIAMAHLTEVAFWRSTPQKSPESVVRSVCGSVALVPDSIIVMESTANGVGNYFHTEWLRAKAGVSDKVAVFVPWHEIEIYRLAVADPAALWRQLDTYERRLWDEGLTLEMINWYHCKRREYSTHSLMKAEYPSNDIEAFTLSGRMALDPIALERLRRGCRPPMAVGELVGDADCGKRCLDGLHLVEAENGCLKVWEMPDNVRGGVKDRYIAVVDVGGTGMGADFSVVAVIDRHGAGGKPCVAAQWRGHVDHDRLAWNAAQIARWYCNAFLVVESNTLETHGTSVAGSYILDVIAAAYPNLYRRARRGERPSQVYGFHTNSSTKPLAVYELIRYVRDGLYVERDTDAVDEMSWFEVKSASSFGAIDGRHDDIVMTRAIAFHVIAERFGSSECPSAAELRCLTERHRF